MFTWIAVSAVMIVVAALLVAVGLRANVAGADRKTETIPVAPMSSDAFPKSTSYAGSQIPAAGSSSPRPQPRQPLKGFDLGCLLLFGLVWSGFSLFGVIFSISMLIEEGRTYLVLKDMGLATEAVITSRRIDVDSEGDTHFVTYRYIASLPQGDQQRFSREEKVNGREYKAMPPESRVTILYNPANPGMARLQAGLSLPIFELFMSCFIGLFLLIGLALLAWGGSALWETLSLALGGQTTVGLITDRWIESDSEDKSYCVAYRFQAPQADGLTRQIDRAEYNYTAYRKYNAGDPVQVLYSRYNPDICRLQLLIDEK